jgi:phage gpG-like protein
MGFKLHGDDFEKFLNRLKERINQILPEIAPEVRDFVVEHIKEGGIPSKPNAPLTRIVKKSSKPLLNRGILRGSISYQIKDGKLIVGTNLVYAPIQHYGGVIKPKWAKTLTLPTTRKVRRLVEAKGVREFVKKLEEEGYKIVWKPKAVIAVPPSAKGKRKRKPKYGLALKNGEGELVLIRKREVKIPARPYMLLTKEELKYLKRRIAEILQGG